jgi:hypothetical protein
MVSSTGCLQACDEGPRVDEQAAEAILDAPESNSVAEKFVLA